MGVEFGAFEMQAKVDSLINADKYNDDVARDIMYYYHAGWAYNEYMDLYKAAWKLNKSLPKGAKKFRIVNLSYQFDWGSFVGPRTPKSLAKVFKNGPPDSFRAKIVQNEVIARKEKILLIVGVPHAFTKYQMPLLDVNSDTFCDFDNNMLGNKLYKNYSEKIFTILFHSPFYNLTNKPPYILSPANGAVEKIMTQRNNLPAGFDLNESPMGMLKDSSRYSMCYNDFRLGNFFDGYVFIRPFKEMEGVTIDTLFFKNRTWETTKRLQQADPALSVKAETMEELWANIKGYVNIKNRYSGLLK